MADATLAMSYDELAQAISLYRGWGGDVGLLSAEQLAALERNVADGLRLFYAPPPLGGPGRGHSWSFLHPVATLELLPAGTGPTVGVPVWDPVTGLSAVVNAAAWFAAAYLRETMTFQTSGHEFPIADYVNPALMHVTGNASGEAAAQNVAISCNGDYDLPADFGVIESDFTLPAGTGYWSIPLVPEPTIRKFRQLDDMTGIPQQAAIRPRAIVEGFKQVWEAMFWPTPDQSYAASYRYRVLPPRVNDANQYPYGADGHGLTIKAACLAACEQEILGRRDVEYQRFLDQLSGSVEFDLGTGPVVLGNIQEPNGRVVVQSHAALFYNGVEI